ncbi:hypothetical protein E2C01_019688 [Portunus trituberculatus]|uniref:Uncharacterized protein n=1 Tax=Portunus trituberculatus TaxID=210409 RepID=A0A5B7DZ56_PORTR|nr:hypothetical protein [Portunus trituberculatus]
MEISSTGASSLVFEVSTHTSLLVTGTSFCCTLTTPTFPGKPTHGRTFFLLFPPKNDTSFAYFLALDASYKGTPASSSRQQIEEACLSP